MTPETAHRLVAINERFYRTYASVFASKRERAWPGMQQVLDRLPNPPERVLDVGCAHGRMAALLAANDIDAEYDGVDASEALMEQARARTDLVRRTRWQRVDLLTELDQIPNGPFDLITIFAVLHHIPGERCRVAILEALAHRLAPGGTLAVALWRTTSHESARDVDWSRVGIDPQELEDGDRLQTFDGDDDALRYAHFAGDAEIERVAQTVGLPVADRFIADGRGQVANAYLLFRNPSR